ncbi:LPD7 domain-containing protein [Phyllobacterium sp. TAF24]|uniref:LPD7 domain-containing protein n=1 Tax=Phyllobacterium sp. TAF24 TaxID=3233068 RepID=UPI003F9D3720
MTYSQELLAGLEGLSFRVRSLRQAAIDANLVQQGVFDTSNKGKTSPPVKAISQSGKPRSGVAVKSGARLIDTSIEDEWKKRRQVSAGGGGGSVGALKSGRPAVRNSPVPAKSPADTTASRVKIASGSQAAVVKIASYAGGAERVGKLLQYQGREGQIALEREDGSKIEGAHALAGLAREWTDEELEREPSKDVLRLVLDIEGVEYKGRGGQRQIASALYQALPGHRFAWAAEERSDGTTRVEIVMSAAARRQGDDTKANRIFDNRKSLAQLEDRFDRAFGGNANLDIRGFAHGYDGTLGYLAQLTSGGSRPAQSVRLTRDGKFAEPTTLIGFSANKLEAKDWKRDLRSREQRDVAHIILSAKAGTNKDAFVDAARATLATEFAGHQYGFLLHEDKAHVHVHAVVKMRAETGERINPYTGDFQRWRETLAKEAGERNIPMDAVSRFERSNPPAYKLKDIRRVERGVASDNVRRRVDAVRSGKPHIPVREEGKKRANEVLLGWRAVEAIAASRTFEPSLAEGATRLYRADRPGAALTSAPLFTRDRQAATRMAERSGGSVSYIDVSPAELAALKPSRADVLNQFVVSPELAAGRKPLDQPTTATILAFKNRAEQAVAGAALREVAQQSPKSGVNIDMPNLETMQSAFDDINTQMKVVEDTLPVELLPQVETVRKKMDVTQRDMLDAQKNIERKRGAVEGGRYVEPVPTDIGGFISEKRGETIRYSHLKDDGEIGKVAFIDNGKKVEIHDWKNRDAVLAAMQLSSQKWGNLTVTGTLNYKALVVELAAEHGFQIANPELQGQLARETARLERLKEARPGFAAGNAEKTASPSQDTVIPSPQVPLAAAEVPTSGATDRATAQSPAFIDTGALVKINDRADREAVRTAMEAALKKWGEISVTGTARDKDQAVSIAAEHGYKLANPELQEKLAKETARFEREREKEATRVVRETAKAPGFIDASIARNQGIEAWDKVMKASAAQIDAISTTPAQWQGAEQDYREALNQAAQLARTGNAYLMEKAGQEKVLKETIDAQDKQAANEKAEQAKPVRTEGEISIALDTVRVKVENEAARETRQAHTSSATQETPYEGGGSDHAYRTQAEAGAATRASNAVEQDPKRQMPVDVNQSPQVEKLAHEQLELLQQKQAAERAQSENSKPKQKQ